MGRTFVSRFPFGFPVDLLVETGVGRGCSALFFRDQKTRVLGSLLSEASFLFLCGTHVLVSAYQDTTVGKPLGMIGPHKRQYVCYSYGLSC